MAKTAPSNLHLPPAPWSATPPPESVRAAAVTLALFACGCRQLRGGRRRTVEAAVVLVAKGRRPRLVVVVAVAAHRWILQRRAAAAVELVRRLCRQGRGRWAHRPPVPRRQRQRRRQLRRRLQPKREVGVVE